ncbi:aspartyl/glutamyl-tRNA amidotransferase subunit A [Entomoplasma ellychniae]|uniref:Aspartyl/glutamyl-tRNA amidotransferase subunit A n=1 Tax=Entomoplasma ellychniae TaxID=2114 RepID=A0A8E2QZB8_9MOLU|nr:amidase family protein [Entomoplasma ellychniae]PPE04958.1 aspartyl/glutamyl-tRNA amidotransferase subunit A [Entomoplasma ellychniae]
MKYNTLSIEQLHELLKNGKTTPSEIAKQLLFLCEQEKHSNAINFLNKEVLKEAELLELKQADNSLLFGIPYAAKDNISTKGIPTCASSNILKGYIPSFDATIISKLKDNQTLMLCKTALDELGMGGVGLYSSNGEIYNPYDSKRIVGGSSSGSAYLVAKGIVPFAIGTDTGDSIRKPASLNNIVGFKPSYGAISRYGLLPYSPSLDTIGFFTRNVNDIAILCDATFGYDKRDATSIVINESDFYKNINSIKKTKKYCYIKYVIEALPNELKEKYYSFFNQLKKQGYEVMEVDFPKELLLAVSPVYMMISYSESASTNANLDGIKFGARVDGDDYEAVIKNTRNAGFGEEVKKRFLIGSLNLNKDKQLLYLNQAKKVRRLIVEQMSKIFQQADILIVPPFYDIAPLVSDIKKPLTEEQEIITDILILANMNGSPSITIPFTKKAGMGIGINFITKPKSDLLCLQAAKVAENIIGIKNQIVGENYE